MIIPITESNPKIQCQYVLLKAGEYFLWISYDTYCLKVSLSKKLILLQFSQKEITIFLNENKKKKLKNKKKKKNPTYSLFAPHLFQRKYFLDGLILGGK